MKICMIVTVGALVIASAQANTKFILRYTESEPLSVFLARYQLRLEASVPSRPIHSVVDVYGRNPQSLIQRISDDTDDDVSIELDQIIRLPILSFKTRQASALNLLLQAFSQPALTPFFGVIAPQGAITQYALPQVRATQSWAAHGQGSGTVAVIDTGVDLNHPFFKGRLAPGADLLTPSGTGSELTGLRSEVLALINPTTTPLLRKLTYLSNGTAPMFPSHYATHPHYPLIPIGLGHGTMVAGAVRLVAPAARILPIRAFHQNGTGRLFDVIRGMHLAEIRGAKVVNMSFNTYTYSPELSRSSEDLSDRGVMLIASTGNDGLTQVASYPAVVDKVTGVASLTPSSVRSVFSNAGSDLTWVSAPGEGLMLPFPGDRWAGGWGTSFSAPLVSGLASKILKFKPNATYSDLQSALGKSHQLFNPDLGLGRLDVFASMAGL